MSGLYESIQASPVAATVLFVSVAIAIGNALGSLGWRGIHLGVAGVLFAGLGLGHFGLVGDLHILHFLREFGLILFVYAIGMQVGPGFFASLKANGLRANLLAVAVILLGVGMTVMMIVLLSLPVPAAVGLLSGAVTNTPGLAAAQQAMADLPDLTDEERGLPGMMYAVAYPLGVVGIIVVIQCLKLLFRADPTAEAAVVAAASAGARPVGADVKVMNPGIAGKTLRDILQVVPHSVVFSRLWRAGTDRVPRPEDRIESGDVLRVVSPPSALAQVRLVFGDNTTAPPERYEGEGAMAIRRLVVTNRVVLGRHLDHLDLPGTCGVTITRINRAGIEFVPNNEVRLQFGDTVVAVGDTKGLLAAEQLIGNSAAQLNQPQVMSMFIGIALGVVVGMLPVVIPGIPVPVKMGLAGGPLLVALALTRINSWRNVIFFLPPTAGQLLRDIGISCFLAAVGLSSGENFLATVANAKGVMALALGFAITTVPLIVVGCFARWVMKFDFAAISGILSGSMTDPPALAFANTICGSEAPAASYATVYPLAMLMRLITAQLLVLVMMGATQHAAAATITPPPPPPPTTSAAPAAH